jgi:hypothetical protein
LSKDEATALKKTSIKKGPRKDGKANKKPLSDYSVGSTVPGKVVSIMPYGAFVDIGATTGLNAKPQLFLPPPPLHSLAPFPLFSLSLSCPTETYT